MRLLDSGARSSVVVVHGLSTCGTWAQFSAAWDLPRQESDPMSPLLGRVLTPEPPGEALHCSLFSVDF